MKRPDEGFSETVFWSDHDDDPYPETAFRPRLTAATAAPASAETSVRVTLTGKSPAEVRAAIEAAAHTVCKTPYAGEYQNPAAVDACVQETVVASLLRAKVPAPAPASVQPVTFASSEPSVRIPLAGKSAGQIYAAIVDAAHTVCNVRVPGMASDVFSIDACVKDTVSATIERAKIPALSQYAAGAGYERVATN
jgi:hypothetical protein